MSNDKEQETMDSRKKWRRHMAEAHELSTKEREAQIIKMVEESKKKPMTVEDYRKQARSFALSHLPRDISPEIRKYVEDRMDEQYGKVDLS